MYICIIVYVYTYVYVFLFDNMSYFLADNRKNTLDHHIVA